MSLSCEGCVLGTGLCDRLIPRPDDSVLFRSALLFSDLFFPALLYPPPLFSVLISALVCPTLV